jgi:hypothetical protein
MLLEQFPEVLVLILVRVQELELQSQWRLLLSFELLVVEVQQCGLVVLASLECRLDKLLLLFWPDNTLYLKLLIPVVDVRSAHGIH